MTASSPTITSVVGYGAITNGGTNADDVLTLDGVGTANSTVTVFDGSVALGTVTVNGSGVWQFTTGELGEGSHIFSANGLDQGAEVSQTGREFKVTVETLSGGGPASIGINMDGAEYSWGGYPTLADLENVKSEGVNLVRLPIAWEMMQATLGGPLNASYLAGLETFLNNAASLGIKVIVDLHNAGTYNLNWAADAANNHGIVAPDQADASVLGSASVPISSFANLWQQLATALKGNPAVAGYDLMNEPNNMPSPSTWPDAAQAAVNAIRSVDMNTPIIVEGDAWASARYWQVYNSHLHVNDSANNIIYEGHQYFDNGSGQYTQTYAQLGNTSITGVQEVTPYLQWLQENNYKGYVGELGIPNNNPQWIPLLNNVLNTLQAAGISASVWNYEMPDSAPTWWVKQIESSSASNLNIAPINGSITPTMALIFEHSSPEITWYSPNSGDVNDSVSNASVLMFTGIGAGDAKVSVYDGTTLLGTTVSQANGAWSFTTPTLATGAHSFWAQDQDSSGDLSEPSTLLDVTVQASTAPAVSSIVALGGAISEGGDPVANPSAFSLHGTAQANGTVEVFEGTTDIGTASVGPNGTWTFATGQLLAGDHRFTVVDGGTLGTSNTSATLNVTVDNPQIRLTHVAHEADGAALLTGTAEPLSCVLIYADGSATPFGTAEASASGHWSFVSSVLSDSFHTFSVEAIDSAGNVGISANAGIYAASGNQVLLGGPGYVLSGGHMISSGVTSDTFVLGSNFGQDVINYFHTSGASHDVIQFSTSVFQDFAAVLSHATQVGSSVVIAADATETVTMHNAKLSNLHSNDFQFV